jgi:uncharacterized protein (UPF0335 family)
MNYGIAADQLKQIVARIERLEVDKAAIQEDLKQVYLQAKSEGFDVVTLRQIISLRKKDPRKLQETESLMELYKQALGMD